MTNTISTLANILALSANITAQEVETIARWQEGAELIEPLGIDTEAFQRALSLGTKACPRTPARSLSPAWLRACTWS